eukprot:CAMPEP_0184671828 /NCGR_PEP_ID=MMETSP0308-20130426/85733_1 /TAXON_ID=38269 /ORGANISM="Gloeochaete witrockiana, Strain SAG 46.84" /LENGTH=311 /DNA_ID=CAMNT_0027119029 /DNA_START=72 /DNA_END=1004 /DNA_ORIENTATION=+
MTGVFITQRAKVNYLDKKNEGSDKFLLPPLVELLEEDSSQSTLLLQKKKEMCQVQDELDRKKDEFKERMRLCQEKEKELFGKQQALREQVIKFEKFLKENDAKRTRAQRKAVDEIKLREAKESEIQILEGQLRHLVNVKDTISRTVDKNFKYQRYLESVVMQSDEFQETTDVVARYATLHGANGDLDVAVQKEMDLIEELKTQLATLIKDKQNNILVSNSEIAELQSKLEETRSSVVAMEQKSVLKEEDANNKNRLLGEIKMSVFNIYIRCQFRQPPEEGHSLVQFLSQVQQRLLDFKDINRQWERDKVAW